MDDGGPLIQMQVVGLHQLQLRHMTSFRPVGDSGLSQPPLSSDGSCRNLSCLSNWGGGDKYINKKEQF